MDAHKGDVVSDLHHFNKNQVRIRTPVKRGIRIRIKVMRIRNPVMLDVPVRAHLRNIKIKLKEGATSLRQEAESKALHGMIPCSKKWKRRINGFYKLSFRQDWWRKERTGGAIDRTGGATDRTGGV